MDLVAIGVPFFRVTSHTRDVKWKPIQHVSWMHVPTIHICSLLMVLDKTLTITALKNIVQSADISCRYMASVLQHTTSYRHVRALSSMAAWFCHHGFVCTWWKVEKLCVSAMHKIYFFLSINFAEFCSWIVTNPVFHGSMLCVDFVTMYLMERHAYILNKYFMPK